MPPKRKSTGGKARTPTSSKKAKPATEGSSDAAKIAEKLLSQHDSYCDELGIDLKKGGSAAAFQWLCCSIIFGNRISEKTTIRAAQGLIKSGLTDPKSVKDSDQWSKVEALNSQGNVQRGPSMAGRLEETAALILDKYDGDLDKLRDAAKKNPEEERKLVKEFKGFGDMAVNIFCREVQLQWDELFPFADDRTLEMAGKQGLPSGSAKELADLVGNDRAKFVKLLGAVVKADLRGDGGAVAKGGAEDDSTAAAGDAKADSNGGEAGEEAKTDEADGDKKDTPQATDAEEAEVKAE